jgi:uncharacterized protein YndB with AHSA1/START domain
MIVNCRHTYAAPPDAVFAAMTSDAVLREKYAALGHRDVEIIEHAEREGGVRVHSRRGVPMQVPGFARRFLSPVNTVVQIDEWEAPGSDGTRHGTWRVSARGVPVQAAGTIQLSPSAGQQTVVEVRGEVTCSIPIVGGKLAAFVGADVERTVHAEEDFNDGHLASAPRPVKRRPRAAAPTDA